MQNPDPSSPNSSYLSSSSSSSSSDYILPLLATSANYRLSHSDTNEIQSVDSIFGSVPNQLEVANAISAFQRFMQWLSSSRSASDWLQPLWTHYYQRVVQSPGYQWVYDAFHLLQTMPSVQRMVASISTDKAVWDAVLKNNEVQEFHRSLKQAEIRKPQGSDEELDFISMILRWILDKMKLKVVELTQMLKSLVNTSIKSDQKENNKPGLNYLFEELIGSTVLLSVITLMIVLVNRVYGT